MVNSKKPKLMMNGHTDEIYTPEYALNPLLPYIKKFKVVWECAWGEGALATHLKKHRLMNKMGILDQLKKFKELFRNSKEEKQEEPKKEMPFDSRPILKDRNGEDLICELCENWDNEYNAYYPIYEGEKKMFMGKSWHINCYRAFNKEARKGNLI